MSTAFAVSTADRDSDAVVLAKNSRVRIRFDRATSVKANRAALQLSITNGAITTLIPLDFDKDYIAEHFAGDSLKVLLSTNMTDTTVLVNGVIETFANQDATDPVIVSKSPQTVTDCLIANGAFLSAGIDLGVSRLVGISFPAALDGVTTISFQASYDGAVWNDLYDEAGTEITLTVAASRSVRFKSLLSAFYGIRYIKVRYGTAAAHATVATADRTLKLISES